MERKPRPGATSILSRSVVSVIVGVLYVAACASPATDEGPPRDYGHIQPFGQIHYGIVALLLGWTEPIPWSANLLLLVGWILLLLKNDTAALGFGIAAALVGLTTWITVVVGKLLVGYYLWQASLIAFALGALAIRLWGAGKEKGGIRMIGPNPPLDPTVAKFL